MDAGAVTLALLACLTWANWTLHYHTHVGTYALFPAVAAHSGGDGFVGYHRAYEKRLPLTMYAPWSALMVASVAFCVVRPDDIGLPVALVLLVLNASIAVLSIAFAAPVHSRIDDRGSLVAEDARALLRWNAVRLAVATASALIIGGLLLGELA